MTYREAILYARKLRKNQTPAEKIFWENVRKRKQLGLKFLRQYLIEHEVYMGQSSYFVPDFYCHEIKLIVEIDGKIHEKQKDYDETREDILKEMNYRIIRFTNQEVLTNISDVTKRLRVFIQSLPPIENHASQKKM